MGTLTGLWMTFKGKVNSWLSWIWRYFHYTVTIEQHNNLYEIVNKYLMDHHSKEFRNVAIHWKEKEIINRVAKSDSWESVRSKTKKFDNLELEQFSDRFFIFHKKWPV